MLNAESRSYVKVVTETKGPAIQSFIASQLSPQFSVDPEEFEH